MSDSDASSHPFEPVTGPHEEGTSGDPPTDSSRKDSSGNEPVRMPRFEELEGSSKEIDLEYQGETAQGAYANSVRITSSSEEFVLDFIRVVPGVESARVQSRVIVTPQHAKRLLTALEENLRTVERADTETRATHRGESDSIDKSSSVPTVEPELLVATFSDKNTPLHCNRPWKSLMGTAQNPWGRLSDSDRDLAESSVQKACGGSLVTNQLVSIETANREEPVPILLNFIPMYDHDQEESSQGATVSGEVLAEPPSWMISQTQRHRMENLGRMTMGVAHDLNNLLSGLIGHIELLKDQIDRASLTDSIRPSIEMIETTAEDGAALIDKLQRYIRHDTQQHFEPVDLPELIEDCITLTEPYWYNEARRQGIEISVETDLEDVPNIMGSSSELREVFVNLTLNAVQAMPEGGTLRFTVYETEEERVCAEVTDTGIGMSEKVRKNIFEPLFTTKGEQGTGMGLSASYGIVQEHEGTIDVESEPDEGTTFTLIFPPAEGEPTSVEEPPSTPSESESVSVLVIDDEEMVRSTISRLLSLNGHEVDLASSGTEALKMFRGNDYDIVFTDYGMPEMTGSDIARELEDLDPDLPVILLTGHTETDMGEEEIDGILSKPFKGNELETTIQKHVFSSA